MAWLHIGAVIDWYRGLTFMVYLYQAIEGLIYDMFQSDWSIIQTITNTYTDLPSSSL